MRRLLTFGQTENSLCVCHCHYSSRCPSFHDGGKIISVNIVYVFDTLKENVRDTGTI